LLTNWRNEAAQFTPELKIVTLHGKDRAERFHEMASVDLILTTYPLLVRDRDTLLAQEYHLLVMDEAQFITSDQFDALVAWVDAPGFDRTVHAFGLTSTFTTELFEGSARFLALSDEIVALPVAARCWCGATGRVNARVVDSTVVRSGPTVLIGDVESDVVEGVGLEPRYVVLCRPHFNAGLVASP
jgi:thymidine kinase